MKDVFRKEEKIAELVQVLNQNGRRRKQNLVWAESGKLASRINALKLSCVN